MADKVSLRCDSNTADSQNVVPVQQIHKLLRPPRGTHVHVRIAGTQGCQLQLPFRMSFRPTSSHAHVRIADMPNVLSVPRLHRSVPKNNLAHGHTLSKTSGHRPQHTHNIFCSMHDPLREGS
ncbi:TPA: hypothetical protein ACH3X2_004906 [Trebouxia sp. C0005]